MCLHLTEIQMAYLIVPDVVTHMATEQILLGGVVNNRCEQVWTGEVIHMEPARMLAGVDPRTVNG